MSRAIMLWWAEEDRAKKENIIRNRILRVSSEPLSQMSAKKFIEHFRLSKEAFFMLCQQLLPHMNNASRDTKIKPQIRILAALNFLATGSYQKPVGANNELNLSQPVVSRCINEVVDALNAREVQLGNIHFPATEQERRAVARRFYELHRFPGTVGCIDGTHVALICPTDHEEAYFNRRRYHSMNVMIICDADMHITHVDASCGGVSHDSHIWNMSPIKAELAALHEEGTHYWLLGDSGYAHRAYMLTPILGAEDGSPEAHYTDVHSSTRSTVERCIGVLKARWRCLLAHRVLHYNPVKAGKIVNACVVLHNIANAARLPVPELEPRERRRDLRRQILIPAEEVDEPRRFIVRRLWRERV